MQASWDAVMLRTELEEKYSDPKLEVTPLISFAKNMYPAFAASTSPAPTLEEAYAAVDIVDDWFLVVKQLNPSWFTETEFTEEEITFSDGNIITVKSQRPSVLIRKDILEYEASKEPPLDNVRRELFRSIYYPLLAGCSFGELPSSEEARTQMSADDIQLWYDTAKRQNPDWFIPFEELATRNQQMQKDLEKKSEPLE